MTTVGVLDTQMCSNTQMRRVSRLKQFFFFLNKQKYHGRYSTFIKVYSVFINTPHCQSIWKKQDAQCLESGVESGHLAHCFFVLGGDFVRLFVCMCLFVYFKGKFRQEKELLRRVRGTFACGLQRGKEVVGLNVCIHHVRSTIPRFCLLLYFVFLGTHYSFTL